MNSAIIFPSRTVDIQNYYYFNEGFSTEELEKIYKYVSLLSFKEGETASTNKENEESVRISRIKWLYPSKDCEWLYDKLLNMIVEANNKLWNFNLFGLVDAIQYTEYHATNNGHYGWHQDIGPNMLSTRKISVTVQLSHPSEYDGGDLEYFLGGNPEKAYKVPKNKGLVFIFPSFMMHRVTPVTRGVRRSFVLWVGGDPYK